MPTIEQKTTLPRLLVVDDEVGNLQTMRRVFRKTYDMTLVSSAKEAIDALRNTTFDVALVDYSMPGLTGIDVLKKALELQPDMGRVLVTAHAEVEEVRSAQASGLSAAVIMKPWEKEAIEKWVGQFTRLRSMRAAVRELKSLPNK